MNPFAQKSELMTIDCDTIRQLRAERKSHVAINQINAFRKNILDQRKVTKLEIIRQEREKAYHQGICSRCFFRPRLEQRRWCEMCLQEKRHYVTMHKKQISQLNAKYRREKSGFITYD